MPYPSQGNIPVYHKASHQDTGADEISVAALSGELADRQASKVGSSVYGWTDQKLLKGAGAGLDPTEIDVPAGATGNAILKAIQQHLGIFWFNNNWLPIGMIFNVVTESGAITWGGSYILFDTAATINSIAMASKSVAGLAGGMTWDKKRYFAARVALNTFSAQIVHLVTGGLTSYTASDNVKRHIGFKLIDAKLYGTVADGTTESTLLLETLTAGSTRRLEIIYDPTIPEARFYVNGVDKEAIADNLPAGAADSGAVLNVSIYNTEAASKKLYIYEFRAFQEE